MERPILFSTPMVQAILQDRKTQTRRVLKDKQLFVCLEAGYKIGIETFCPYGKVGDILWVRETFFNCSKFKNSPLFFDKGDYLYKADGEFIGDHKWKPSIHMPREACRLQLMITSIRVERLINISVNEAIQEGIEGSSDIFKNYDIRYPVKDFIGGGDAAIRSFQSLWTMINGDKSWDDNPWVWIVEFKRIF